MNRTILVCGHGPGISAAVAERFGRAGFAVGLVARSGARLEAAAAALRGRKINAAAFAGDLSVAEGIPDLIARASRELGPIAVLHWNAYAAAAGDLIKAPLAEIRQSLDVGVTGLITAVQAALPDLRQQQGSVLITGGGLAFYDPPVNAMAVQWGVMGLAVAKAAQHKLAGLLSARLRPEGIYVGEIVVTGLVKGTAFDTGDATLEAAAIADKFFELHSARAPASVVLS